ncbi:MAG: putative ABC transporter permease, partial [Clostridia bacterium]|nr:putative ABC transporter permease [Clostridia bacterium]
MNDIKTKEKTKFTIFGFTLTKIMAYFIIYSILGYIVETLFGLVTKGVIESRQSFLYGPFCAIYGVGAVIMILGLQRFNKNNYTLFFGGFLIGSVVEYLISLIGEFVFNIKWWDYSSMAFNINGRV